jgi:peptide/nickel transport system permease protein
MTRFIARRLLLGLVTLVILSVLIFLGTRVLPGNPGRAILGPFADQASVEALNEELGANDPLYQQYWDWISGLLRGDMGDSYAYERPVSTIVFDGFKNSMKLAALAFILVVPLSVAGGVFAALKAGKPADRIITAGSLSVAVIPEFVTSVALLLVFALWLDWLPVSARWPPGTSGLEQIKYLILPATALVLLLFGYIARMARAGTIDALRSDYVRTAIVKGLPRGTVVRRHVLRNSLIPTIAVIATQIGYMIGGLVVIELIFNYNGLGLTLLQAAQKKDYPLLQSATMVVGVVYLLATLFGDLLTSLLNPRIRYASER